jgi:hypothetical protein
MRTAARVTGRPSGLPSTAVAMRTVPSGFGTNDTRRRSSVSASGAVLWVSITIAVPS